jgi:predicted metal-dependent HD superfamily phosphohydrolase
MDLQTQSYLSTLYAQSHRHYHNINHVNQCLGELQRLQKVNHILFKSKIIEEAIWFHDAVYNQYAEPGENERESANLAWQYSRNADTLSDTLSSEPLRNIILATANHTETQEFSPKDFREYVGEAKIMLDIDLHSLGGSWDSYIENGKNIRKEFPYISDNLFLKNRLGFLETLNKRESFFYTDYFKEKYHASSKQNVNKDILLIKNSNFNYFTYLDSLKRA